jgi:uncharacterized membrane protein YgdD (TMEM256/DUF423 family)
MTGSRWQNWAILVAGLSGAMGIAMAASVGHGDSGPAVQWIDKASRMQLVHAVALLVLGYGKGEGLPARLSALFFLLGILCFSGGLYAMALLSAPVVFLVPIGGVCFILGWIALVCAALLQLRR